MIPLTRPSLGGPELDGVARVFASGMLVQGPEVTRFEAAVAERAERRFAIAVSNGTAALELALRALSVGPGDDVLVPAMTWPSPAHAVRLVGAVPVLVDVCPHEWNATPAAFAAARTERTRVAIVIDQFGNPARHAAIAAALPGVKIIEDAACAMGSSIAGRPCGSFGSIACLSFHPRKIVTTGEGGMCLVDDEGLAKTLRALRNHGQSAPGVFELASGNYRMTDFQGAMGSAQLERLDGIVSARRELAARYAERLSLPVQRVPGGALSNHQTMAVLLPEGTTEASRAAFVSHMRARAVEVGALSYALDALPSVGVSEHAMPVARSLVARGVSIPLFPELTLRDQDHVIASIEASS